MRVVRPITDWNQVPVIMDLTMAARILAITPETLKKRCSRGTFPGYKEGALWRVAKDDLIAHIEANKVKVVGLLEPDAKLRLVNGG